MQPSDSDVELVARAQAGDRAALRDLLVGAAPLLRSLQRRHGSSRECEDELQELMAKVTEALPQFSRTGPATFRSWVFTVARRALLMNRRRRQLALVDLDVALEVQDGAPSLEDGVEERQRLRRLQAVLDELPEPQRDVFVLAQVHELPLAEVGEVLELPLGTVKSRLHRARAEIVQRLGVGFFAGPEAEPW